MTTHATPAPRPAAPVPVDVRIRSARRGDIDALMELEHQVFATDRLSRRSLRRFLQSASAVVLVAEADDGRLAGTAIVLFRPRSRVARLYSLAVAPHMGGRGVATMLLEAAEEHGRARGASAIRLEVHEANHPAIARYRKSGYAEFGRRLRYYEDGGDALRFQKGLTGRPATASQ
jgi:ribosomal-protein-alanine N-acetyltransferase